jgi:hypothetical protein
MSLLLLCKSVFNQAVMLKYNMVPSLARIHLHDIETGRLFTERCYWLAMFARQSYYLTLDCVVKSLIIDTFQMLRAATAFEQQALLLKALSYFYMTSLCDETLYTREYISFVMQHLHIALEAKNVTSNAQV